jgi:hypothetical protein
MAAQVVVEFYRTREADDAHVVVGTPRAPGLRKPEECLS